MCISELSDVVQLTVDRMDVEEIFVEDLNHNQEEVVLLDPDPGPVTREEVLYVEPWLRDNPADHKV